MEVLENKFCTHLFVRHLHRKQERTSCAARKCVASISSFCKEKKQQKRTYLTPGNWFSHTWLAKITRHTKGICTFFLSQCACCSARAELHEPKRSTSKWESFAQIIVFNVFWHQPCIFHHLLTPHWHVTAPPPNDASFVAKLRFFFKWELPFLYFFRTSGSQHELSLLNALAVSIVESSK